MELMLIGLFFLAVVAIIGYSVVSGVRDDGPNGRVATKKVQVVAKRSQLTVVSDELPTTTTYLVTFQAIYQQHLFLEFNVDQQEYERISEGITGVLRHKGWQYVSFTPTTQNSRIPNSTEQK